MSWFARSKNTEQNLGVEFASTSQSVSQSVLDLLELLDAENIVLGKGDVVLKKSSGISTLNLVRDQFINHEALLRLVRAARKSGKMQEVTLDLPRGPIGAGTHDLFVRVSPIGNSGLVIVLIFDDSEMRRLDSIRRDFVANISHELKTPIGALSILSEAVLGAKDDVVNPQQTAEFLTNLDTTTTHQRVVWCNNLAHQIDATTFTEFVDYFFTQQKNQ